VDKSDIRREHHEGSRAPHPIFVQGEWFPLCESPENTNHIRTQHPKKKNS